VIVPAGVLLEGPLAGVVHAALVRHVQAERISDPGVHRLLAELSELSRAAVVSVVPDDDGAGAWLTTAEAAAARGVSVRTIERHARAGMIDARREGWVWRIRANG
jgi:hypothetical protein